MNTELQEQPTQTSEQQEPYHRAVDKQLSRLAVHHLVSPYDLQDLPTQEALKVEDQIENVYHVDGRINNSITESRVFRQRLGHENMPKIIEKGIDSEEKTRTLEAVSAAIKRQTKEHASDSAEVPWRAVSHALVENAATMAEGEERNVYLVGAVLTAQFSPDPEDRLALLEDVYGKDMELATRDACYRSHVVLSLGKDQAERIQTYQVRSFVPAFEADKDTFNEYVEYTRKELHKAELPSAKKVQKQLSAEEKGEASDETRRLAQEVGQATEKEKSYIIDLYKLERFALQEEFVKKQMAEVLGPDLKHTPLAEQLKARRKGESDLIGEWNLQFQATELAMDRVVEHVAIELASDIRASFTELSQPVIEKFALPNVGSKDEAENLSLRDILRLDEDEPEQEIDRATLTPEQRASYRFREVTKMLNEQAEIAKFANVEDFLRRQEDEQSTILFADGTMEIGSISQDGAGVPDTIGSLIEITMRSALQQEGPDAKGAELGDVSEEELRDFARRHRRTLLSIATQNIAEMPAVDEIFREGLRRNEQGELIFAQPLNLQAKGSLDVYAAVTLGCPALRLQHATRAELTMAERIAQGSSNYIDHVLAVVINEAYERGMFKKDFYRNLLAAANQKRDQIHSEAA